jgi:hypothetical protein
MSGNFERVITVVDLNDSLDSLIDQFGGVIDISMQRVIENGTTYCLSNMRLSELDPICEIIGVYTKCE